MMFEKLPQEIAAIILGRLSLADLISAKNVSRWFNVQCRELVSLAICNYTFLEKIGQSCYLENSEQLCKPSLWDYSDIHIYGVFRANSRLKSDFDYVKKIAFEISKLDNKSREEYIWLFVLANKSLFKIPDKLIEHIAEYTLKIGAIDSTIIYYFREFYLRTKYSLEYRRNFIVNALNSRMWRDSIFPLCREIMKLIIEDAENTNDDVDRLFDILAKKLSFASGVYLPFAEDLRQFYYNEKRGELPKIIKKKPVLISEDELADILNSDIEEEFSTDEE